MQRTIVYFRSGLRKVAIRQVPPFNGNDDEREVQYIDVKEKKKVKRLDNVIYYGWTDDAYYRVQIEEKVGFVNAAAFEGGEGLGRI